MEQYVFLNHSAAYQLGFWMKGKGHLGTTVQNVTQVSGTPDKGSKLEVSGTDNVTLKALRFTTGSEYLNHMKTVKLKFLNTGTSALILDDVKVAKIR